MKDPKYFFSPSLMDSFQNLIDCEELYETYWGNTSEPSKSIDEFVEECTQGVLNSINGIYTSTRETNLGTAFNDLVDCLVNGVNVGKTRFTRGLDANNKVISADCTIEDYSFRFDINFAKSVAEYFEGSLPQVLVEANIDTKYGIVNVYGFIDELRRDVVYDLKTTSRYEFGKYAHKWQKVVYPYCLIESKRCTDIKEFEYTIFPLIGGNSKNPLISGNMYREVYTYNHDTATKQLREHCERLIEFIESRRDLITCNKIFTKHEHIH